MSFLANSFPENNWRGVTLLSVPSKVLAKLIITRISEAVDQWLRQEQPSFRNGLGCKVQIFPLNNIIKQCSEWQGQLYNIYVDFEKDFDSIPQESLWRILRAYGIPQQTILVIKTFYKTSSAEWETANPALAWKPALDKDVLSRCCSLTWQLTGWWASDRPQGIRWTLFSTLKDLDSPDDLARVSNNHQQMQEKTTHLNMFAWQVRLKISQKKTEVMMLNVPRLATSRPHKFQGRVC